MIGLDTNLLLRWIVIDDDGQSARAEAFIDRTCSAAAPGFINRIVLCEFIWTLDRSYGYARAKIANAVDALLKNGALLVEDADHVEEVLPHYVAGRAGFADLLIAKINRARGCEATATFDRKAARLDGFVPVR
jgi:predicted nucleic-acid-binding protein